MDINSIVRVDITEEMIAEAQAEQKWLDENKEGAKTRDAYHNKTLIGSLGHQAVEHTFENMDFAYTSTRKIKYKQGDTYDIQYENDYIDVKATHGKLDEKWFFNKEFLVFQAQLDDPKIDLITHFVFVLVDMDEREAYIFGAIHRSDFMSNSNEVKANNYLKWDNRAIKAKQLKPFISYICRT